MLLKLSKDLIAQGIGDLGIHTRVPDVPVSQMISNILDTASGFKQMDSNGVPKRMDISRFQRI